MCAVGHLGWRRRTVTIGVVLVLGSSVGWWAGNGHRIESAPWTVIDAIDGDTIIVERGGATDTIRLLGVDTPETHHPTKGVQCFGPEAAWFTRRALEGRQVVLEGDIESTDIYGRTLAYVYLDGKRFNDVLLRKGFARLLVIPPNRAHGRVMLDVELAARDARRGLWSACPDD